MWTLGLDFYIGEWCWMPRWDNLWYLNLGYTMNNPVTRKYREGPGNYRIVIRSTKHLRVSSFSRQALFDTTLAFQGVGRCEVRDRIQLLILEKPQSWQPCLLVNIHRNEIFIIWMMKGLYTLFDQTLCSVYHGWQEYFCVIIFDFRTIYINYSALLASKRIVTPRFARFALLRWCPVWLLVIVPSCMTSFSGFTPWGIINERKMFERKRPRFSSKELWTWRISQSPHVCLPSFGNEC